MRTEVAAAAVCCVLHTLWAWPAGDALATCSYDGTWRLWDVGTGASIMEQEGHSRAVYSIGFHTDGSLCGSGGFDAVARVWDCRTGRSVLTFQGHTYGVLAMAFSPNGYHVATGAARHGSLGRQRPRCPGPVNCTAFSLRGCVHRWCAAAAATRVVGAGL